MAPISAFQQAFAEVLKILRTESSLSQQQLALGCNLDRSYISLLERGLRQPSLLTIFQIAKVLKVAPSKLVALAEERSKRK